MAYFGSCYFGQKLSFYFYLLLFLTVWLIYTADHMADAIKAGKRILSQRHYFHKLHFVKLVLTMPVLAMVILTLAFKFLPLPVLTSGFSLGLLCLGYLIYSYVFKNYFIPREIMVACLYTAGVLFGSVSSYVSVYQTIFLFAITFIFAWNNILLFAVVSKDEDIKSGFSSIAGRLNHNMINFIFYTGIILNFVIPLTGIIVFPHKSIFFFILILLNILFIMVKESRDRLSNYGLFRITGEALFIVPGLIAGILKC